MAGKSKKTAAAKSKRVLIFIGDDYEDMELMYPKYRFIEAGIGVTVAGPEANKTYYGKNGYPCKSDIDIAEMDASDFHGVILAGGWMPDKLRRNPKVLELVRAFHKDKKLIGAICHGGWMAVSANVVRGVKVTGSPGIKDDLTNAGGIYSDASVVVDGHHVSSRKPDDLPDFMRACLKVLEGVPA
jgi:protease I